MSPRIDPATRGLCDARHRPASARYDCPRAGGALSRANSARVFRGRRDPPGETKVIAAALSAVACLVDESTDDRNAEPANRSLFARRIEIQSGMGERIEGRAVVDKIDRQPAAAQAEGGGNALRVTVRDDIGEELFEDDEEPGPFVVGDPAIAGECLGEGQEPGKLGGNAAEGYRSPHRGLMLLLPSPGLRSQPSVAGLGPGVAQVNKLPGLVAIMRPPAKIGDPPFEKDIAETGADAGSE